VLHSSETNKEYTTTDSKEDLVCIVCDGTCFWHVIYVWSVDTNVKPHLMISTFVFTCNFIGNKLSFFMCFRWYCLFSGVKGCLELLITQLKLRRYGVMLDYLMSNFKIIIIHLLQGLWLVLHWSFSILNPKLIINGNTSFKNKALVTELSRLFISHIHFKWRYRLITVV
jgi:hypothetical protein